MKKIFNIFNRRHLENERLRKKDSGTGQDDFWLTNLYDKVLGKSESWNIGITSWKTGLLNEIYELRKTVIETQGIWDKKNQELEIKIRMPAESISLLHLFRTEFRQGYDSSWTVILMTLNGIEVLYLTCGDEEYTDGLAKKIEYCQMVSDVKALDQKKLIWYD